LGIFGPADLALAQWADLPSAPTVNMPARADSNSPTYWRDGDFYILNSTGTQLVSRGSDQFTPYWTQPVWLDSQDHLPMWIESVWQDSDGTLFGWYHHEPAGVCSGSTLTAPEIGAVVSYDGGMSFVDLGIVLASGDPVDCNAKNGFFAGGNGDFSVILDRDQAYFYFLFDNYGGDLSGQGVAIARMAFGDRQDPVGAVSKYFQGDWTEPGLGGRLSPVFPAAVGWQQSKTDSFWGPSVHWNTYLESYVVLLNHACCAPNWPQEGIYIAYNPDLSNPAGWTAPYKILGKVTYDAGYYPQVIGTNPGESDTVAGQVARLYVHGRSDWTIVFSKDGPPAESEPVPEPPAAPTEGP
jgi:hypothetical protein